MWTLTTELPIKWFHLGTTKFDGQLGIPLDVSRIVENTKAEGHQDSSVS